MSESSAVELLIEPRERRVGSGTVRRLLPWRQRRMVGPFVFADVMGPEKLAAGTGVDVDAHPHIGLSTLTYLLRGRLVHRDSTGVTQRIEPGAVNWMTAGGGVAHTERSADEDRAALAELFGLQLWVALPGESQDGPASFEHCASGEVPLLDDATRTVRVAAGSGFGLESPVTGSSPLVLAEIELRSGSIVVPGDHPERAVIVVDGDVRIDDRTIGVGRLAVLEPGNRPTLSGTGTAVVLGGAPLGRRHIWWNFVHSDPEAIEAAKQRWLDQEFPTVPGDHEPYVPLPG